MNFVADSATRSAPSSSGRQRYAEANVLSTDEQRAVAMGDRRQRRDVGDDDGRVRDRLDVQDPGRAAAASAASTAAWSVASTNVDAHPEPGEHVHELRPGGAVDGPGADDPVAGRQNVASTAWIAAIPLANDLGVLGAVDLGDRGLERRAGRVGDPRVGVAGPPAGRDVAQLLGVVGAERDRLVDRDGVRLLVDARQPVVAALMARVEKPVMGRMLHRVRPTLARGHRRGDRRTRPTVAPARLDRGQRDRRGRRDRVAIEPSPPPLATHEPTTRSRPWRFERYIVRIGRDHEVVDRPAVARIDDDADRQRGPDVDAIDLEGPLAHADPDLLGQHERAGRVRLGEHDDELVAAVAGRRVDPPDAGPGSSRPPSAGPGRRGSGRTGR